MRSSEERVILKRVINAASVRRGFARHEGKGRDGPDGAGEVAVGFGPLLDHRGGGFAAAAEGEVRDEGAEFELDAGGEEGVVDLFAELVEERMAVADAGPEDVPVAAVGEAADTFDGEEEGFYADRGESSGDFFVSGAGLIAEEAKREVNLCGGRPLHTWDFVVERGHGSADGIGGVERDEKTGGN